MLRGRESSWYGDSVVGMSCGHSTVQNPLGASYCTTSRHHAAAFSTATSLHQSFYCFAFSVSAISNMAQSLFIYRSVMDEKGMKLPPGVLSLSIAANHMPLAVSETHQHARDSAVKHHLPLS